METSPDVQILSLMIGLKRIFIFNRNIIALNSALLVVVVGFGILNLRSYRASLRQVTRFLALVEKRLMRAGATRAMTAADVRRVPTGVE